mgnify:CR=1 FL=1
MWAWITKIRALSNRLEASLQKIPICPNNNKEFIVEIKSNAKSLQPYQLNPYSYLILLFILFEGIL